MARPIILVGACYVDTILTVPHFPEEDAKLRAKSLVKRPGGNVPNTSQVLAQLLDNLHNKEEKHQISLCVVLPAESSPAVREIKTAVGPTVDFSLCIFRDEALEPASSYIVKSAQTGSRTIVNFNALDEMCVGEFEASVKRSAGTTGPAWCHFEGRISDVTLGCMRLLRREFAHTVLSVEVEKPGRDGLEELASEADVVFYSRSWAEAKGYKSAGECLRAQAAKHTPAWAHRCVTLCCTWGAEGATALEFPAMGEARCPAFTLESRPLVDAIGAGDTFIAGMLYALTHTEEMANLQDKLAFANELAGRKVTQEGFQGLGAAMRHAFD